MAIKSYRQHASVPIRRLTANLIALGDAWRGTAPPIRMLGWTLASVLAGACLVAAAKFGIVGPDIETILRYGRSW